MRYSFLFLIAIVVWSACTTQSPEEEKQALLASKKATLSAKKAEMKALQVEVDQLSEEILALEPAREKAPILITTQSVEPQTFKRYTQVQASVQSDDQVFVSSEIGGRLLKVLAKEGDYVKKGQLLASVDLKTLQDQKTELEVGLGLAKDVYDRQKRLWEQNIGSEIQYLKAKNDYERLEKTVATLETQIKKANVYSPISGVIDREFLKAGEVAAPGAPILQLFNPNKLKIAADVPETYLGKIRKGDVVNIHFPAIGKEITKKVELLGSTIDPSNRTFKVEVATSNEGGALKPNLLAELKFNDYTKEEAIVVPLEIVQEEVSGRKYVFIVGEQDGKSVAKKSYVTIGEGYEGNIVVENGLKAGDEIILDGARSVANGDPIKNMTK